MNVDQTSTLAPAHEASQPASLPRRTIQRLTRSPATLPSPAARWAITALAVVGAGLTVWSGVIHLQLWSQGYRDIPVIGPLFLIQGIATIVLALASAPVDPDDLPAILTAVADTPERLAVAHDNAAELRRELGRLPEAQARAVAMAGIYGMTARQIADAEDVPLGTAKTRIRDGMQKLRAAYLPEEASNE